MVATCCMCKLTSGEREGVSFHRIPKNETTREQWLAVIKKQPTKTSTVCSLHFKKTDFSYKVIDGTVKRSLLQSAVPSSLEDIPSFEHAENQSLNQHFKTVVNTTKCQSFLIVPCDSCTRNVNGDSSSSNSTDSSSQAIDTEVPVLSEDTRSSCSKRSENEPPDQYINTCKLDDITDERRKTAQVVRGLDSMVDHKRSRTIRYVGDLRRDDFTSDRAFEVVRAYVTKTQKKLKKKNNIVHRLQKKNKV